MYTKKSNEIMKSTDDLKKNKLGVDLPLSSNVLYVIFKFPTLLVFHRLPRFNKPGLLPLDSC